MADDCSIARRILRKRLPADQFDVVEAQSGAQCLQLYSERRPDLTFLDLTMPDMDGFETLARLRQLDPTARVIVVTADAQSLSRQQVMELGALAVLLKPVEELEIRALLDRLLP